MPLISDTSMDFTVDHRQSERAMVIRTGILRGFEESDWVFVPEVTLANGRRVDLIALNSKGIIRIIEIKSSIADFKSDDKWHEYRDFCDEFYFASHPEVPGEIFPETEGFILADGHGCEILREGQVHKLAGPTRKALTLHIARVASQRLKRFTLHQGVI
ncbi:MAG: MmcB family DNA repair protein [Pseudomonadota bacterium]